LPEVAGEDAKEAQLPPEANVMTQPTQSRSQVTPLCPRGHEYIELTETVTVTAGLVSNVVYPDPECDRRFDNLQLISEGRAYLPRHIRKVG